MYRPVADPLGPFTGPLTGFEASADGWPSAEDTLVEHWWSDALSACRSDEGLRSRDGAEAQGGAPSTSRRNGGTIPEEPSRRSHRRQAKRPNRPTVVCSLIEGATALIATAVCALGYLLSYGPLHHLAEPRVPQSLAQPWPVVIYGPWLAACLSLLRAALDGRRVVHSWCVVVAFSSVATVLCIADVPRTTVDTVVAGLPPITAAVALHQLVRQLRMSRGQRRQASRARRHRGRRG
ncbi:DUF2637 domain-containing protein [Streptacidiphilus pinicola]|uniref:DUF2637 domain-containing protein n=1 Tax=Streptacidiphilus pinicola TaxID=2219663 RepID=UPI001403A1B4|nr:DUF2637 domain-containing protein [Streptacidiphilus pinicola]